MDIQEITRNIEKEVPGRNDLVGVDVIAELVHFAFEFHADLPLLAQGLN